MRKKKWYYGKIVCVLLLTCALVGCPQDSNNPPRNGNPENSVYVFEDSFYHPHGVDDELHIRITLGSESEEDTFDPTIFLRACEDRNSIDGCGELENINECIEENKCYLHFSDPPGSYNYLSGSITLEEEENNVFHVIIELYFVPPDLEWDIKIESEDIEPTYVTYTVADHKENAKQPYLFIPSTVDFGAFDANDEVLYTLDISNRGTGPLTIKAPIGAYGAKDENGNSLENGFFINEEDNEGDIKIDANTQGQMIIKFIAPDDPGIYKTTVKIEYFSGTPDSDPGMGGYLQKLLILKASSR